MPWRDGSSADEKAPVNQWFQPIECQNEWCFSFGGMEMLETITALGWAVKVSSVPELSEIEDIEGARAICAKCPYSEL